MNFKDAKSEIIENHSLRAKSIPTNDMWNQHTKNKSMEVGHMNLKPYFINCLNYDIYGLENLTAEERDAIGWEVF